MARGTRLKIAISKNRVLERAQGMRVIAQLRDARFKTRDERLRTKRGRPKTEDIRPGTQDNRLKAAKPEMKRKSGSLTGFFFSA